MNISRAISAAAARHPFKTTNVTGRKGLSGNGRLGRIPESLLAAEYVVYSYDTPILWFHRGVWHANTETYSVTSTKHLSQMRRAVGGAVVEH